MRTALVVFDIAGTTVVDKGNVADNIINRILMLVDHYKNGLLMYLNSILHGENVIFLQY